MKINSRLGLKVCIIRVGHVGSTFAYALMIRGLASEIVLFGANKVLAAGQAEDMSHGLPWVSPTTVYTGDYADCKNADIVVITAGAARQPGESRFDLSKRNVDIFLKIIPNVYRVIGSGTTLDSSRFRCLLSREVKVDLRNRHAYIIDEHGDSETEVWSQVHICGVKLDDYCQSQNINMQVRIRDAIF